MVSADPGFARGMSRLGWLLIALSAVLVIFMQPLGEIGRLVYVSGNLTTAPSEIVDVERLAFSEGYRGRIPVYALRYRFRAEGGLNYTGTSYVSQSELGSGRNRAVVEYRAGLPQISRLQGHRITPHGPHGLVVLLPGLIGVLLGRLRWTVRDGAVWPTLGRR